MTVAEKKAFFDKVDRIMSMNGKKDCKDGDNPKECDKGGKSCCKNGDASKKDCSGADCKKGSHSCNKK